jgi:hypothetical protein
MLLAPNPKTCTQYKKKKSAYKYSRERDKPCHMYIRCQNTQQTRGIKKKKKTAKKTKKRLESEMHTKYPEKVW